MLSHCKNTGSASLYAAGKTTRCCAARANIPTISACPVQAYAWIVRSSHAHGIIRGIDTATASAMPGVLGVWTGKDLAAAGYNPFTCGSAAVSNAAAALNLRKVGDWAFWA